jgi:RND family efflux transporter MFP subunit
MIEQPASGHALRRKIPYPRVFILGGGTILILAALTYYVVHGSQPPAPAKYMTAPVRIGSLSQTDSATGEVVPANTFTVSTPANATLQNLNVHYEQQVASGTILATFTDPTLAGEVASQQATVLNDQNHVSELASPTYTASQNAALAQLQDNLSQDQAQLTADKSLGTITAPATGTVSHIVPAGTVVSQGQTVATVSGKNVSASISGTVQNLNVGSGSTVNAGSPLLSISSPQLTAKILGDESQVANVQSQLDKAELQDSPSQLSTQLSQAKAQLQRDQETLTQEQASLSGLTVKAPFSGQVVSLNTSSGTKVLTLDSSSLMVSVPIPENQINAVHANQQVSISLPAVPNKSVSGHVQTIAPVGTYSNGVSTYPVNIALSDPPGVRYGMTAQVSIVIQSVQHAMLVPLAAIHSRGSHNFVETLGSNNQVSRVPVHIILTNNTTAAVKSRKLSSPDRVVTATLTSSSGKLHLKAKGRALHKGKKGGKGGKGAKGGKGGL